jgi:hypothetical protein
MVIEAEVSRLCVVVLGLQSSPLKVGAKKPPKDGGNKPVFKKIL